MADKKTILNIIYKDKATQTAWVKRCIIDQFILDKVYRYFDEGNSLEYLSTNAKKNIEVLLIPQGIVD